MYRRCYNSQCGDVNAQSTLWGGKRTDIHGEIILLKKDKKSTVCLNDGRGTRLDVHTGKTSVLDLTLVSSHLAGMCEWDVSEETTLSCDHFTSSV